MAISAAAALLDELMGRTRNCDPNENPKDLHWEDDTVCKHFLCGFCPNVLFTNTKADFGACSKVHDEEIRKQYEESSRFEKMGYEEEFMQILQTMISDVEKKIRRGHQRLALNSSHTLNGGLLTEREDKITMLTEKINELVSQAEELGSEGKVEEAQGVLKLCDQLKEERAQVQNQSSSLKEELPQMKQMEVCQVCGAFLIVDDAPQRQDEHLSGKLHAGYATVRDEIERRRNKKKAELEEREQRRLREQEKEREERRKKEKEREDRRDRDRGRDRDRDRKRRSRSRSRGRRSRSRERKRSRSRDRRRSRERPRSRSRSERSSRSSKSSRRSRSRSRDRERSSSSRKDKDRKRDEKDRGSKSHSKDREKDKEKEEKGGAKKDDRERKEENGSAGKDEREKKEENGSASKDEKGPSPQAGDAGVSPSQGVTETD